MGAKTERLLSMRRVRQLMERRARGEILQPEELATLIREARLLRRKLAELKARYPDQLWISLHEELDALALEPDPEPQALNSA